MDIKNLKEQLKVILAITKPFITKLVEEKIIPAAKTYMYSSLAKKKDRIVNSLLKLLDKYENEEDETKKAAHKTGLTLGIEAISAIGQSLTEAAETLKAELN